MANCHSLFRKFDAEIKLSDGKVESLRSSRNAIRKKIRDYFKNKGNGFVPKFHGQGSFMMGTIIKPSDGEFDIDDGVYFLVDQKPYQAIETLHRWIWESVNGHTDEPPQDKNTCIRVRYANHYHIDLPIYYRIDGECPKLAHKAKGWIDSDPREFISWFCGYTDKKGELRRIIRYLKSWCDSKSGKLPSGLILSILATHNVQFNDRDDIALLNTLYRVQKQLDRNFSCYRPTTPTDENLLASCSQTDKNYFLTQLHSLIETLEIATHSQTTPEQAAKVLCKHFGSRFPTPDYDYVDTSLMSEAYRPKSVFIAGRPANAPRGFA